MCVWPWHGVWQAGTSGTLLSLSFLNASAPPSDHPPQTTFKLYCPEDKSRGTQRDIEAQQKPRGAGAKPTERQMVSGQQVERLVGRIGYMAQIEPAAGVHMPALYSMERVTRPARPEDRGRRRRPGKLAVWGAGEVQGRYQQALA